MRKALRHIRYGEDLMEQAQGQIKFLTSSLYQFTDQATPTAAGCGAGSRKNLLIWV